MRGWYQKADVGIQAMDNGLYYLSQNAVVGGQQTSTLTLNTWTGDPEAAAALAATRTARELPTVLSVSEELTAQGVLQSLRTGDDAAADIAAALSTLTRAAALLPEDAEVAHQLGLAL